MYFVYFSSHRTEESIIAIVPNISNFRRNWTYVRRTFRVPLYLVRMDGVIYSTGKNYTYMPQPGPLDELAEEEEGLNQPPPVSHSHVCSPTDVGPPTDLSGTIPPQGGEVPLHERRNQPGPPPLNLHGNHIVHSLASPHSLTSPNSLPSPHPLTSPHHLTSPHSTHLTQSPDLDPGFGSSTIYPTENHGNHHMTNMASSGVPNLPTFQNSNSSVMSNSCYHDNHHPSRYYYSSQGD